LGIAKNCTQINVIQREKAPHHVTDLPDPRQFMAQTGLELVARKPCVCRVLYRIATKALEILIHALLRC